MSIIRAKEYLKQWNEDKNVLEFQQSSATVELAAVAVGCEPRQIAKTLSFNLNGTPILIVAAGDAKIDNAKYKQEFHVKGTMLAYEDVERLIGHDVGGVCPFGINDGIDVYLDVSLKRFDFVYPACGSANSAIKLTVSQLEKYSKFKNWVDVCKNWQS